MVDHRKIIGQEFVIIDGVVGNGTESSSEYFLGRVTAQDPLRYGKREAKGVGYDQLIAHGLAQRDGELLIIDRPACLGLRDRIVGDLKGGLLGRLLKMLVIKSGDAPGELLNPDGIYSELGIGDRAYILTRTLMDRGLVSQQPQYHKLTGANYALVVNDDARRLVRPALLSRMLRTAFGKQLSEKSAATVAGWIITGLGIIAVYVWKRFSS